MAEFMCHTGNHRFEGESAEKRFSDMHRKTHCFECRGAVEGHVFRQTNPRRVPLHPSAIDQSDPQLHPQSQRVLHAAYHVDEIFLLEQGPQHHFRDRRSDPVAIDDYELLWDKKAWEQRWEKDVRLDYGSEVVGFEAMGRTNEEMKKILEEWFGRTWAYGSVSHIEYKDAPKSLKTFDVAGDTPEGNLTEALYRHGDESLTLYKERGSTEDIEELKRVLSHELAHTWDWERNRRLPLQERIQMLSEIMRLFSDPDHFHSLYVEIDTLEEFKDLPAEQLLYRQAKEFWATLNEEYDTRPAILKKHPKDYKLVAYWRERLTRPMSIH